MNKGVSCKPYEFPSCAHHTDPPPGIARCDTLPSFKTPKCLNTCEDKAYDKPYKADKHFAKSAYGIMGVENIQRELMDRGPISVAMTVFQDFELYAGGVYQHVKGAPLGGHAIKLIGWGVDEETGTPFWTCVNSWNTAWGEGGTFRIKRGSNECMIESEAVAGEA